MSYYSELMKWCNFFFFYFYIIDKFIKWIIYTYINTLAFFVDKIVINVSMSIRAEDTQIVERVKVDISENCMIFSYSNLRTDL